jgi:hypothetical protein
MSEELIKKLRSYNPTSGYSRVMREAADELEQLRAITKEVEKALEDVPYNGNYAVGIYYLKQLINKVSPHKFSQDEKNT